jgi:choline dehydrogenase-like flavoprotein
VDEKYDLILAGTGFASTFFLQRYLELAGDAPRRVLVLEKGPPIDHKWWLANRAHFHTGPRSAVLFETKKLWQFTLGFGGGSNCWWGCTPRFLPADFELHSRYGVGRDWPLGYADLEPYYCDAEDLLGVAGDSEDTPFERSRPYPQPPHRFNFPDRALKAAFPDAWFIQPAARPTQALPSGRPACCNNGACNACPIDSKYTVRRELGPLYEDPRVTLRTAASVHRVLTRGGLAYGVEYEREGRSHEAQAEFVALGANPIFNAHILLASGIQHPELGRGLHEQMGVSVIVDLDGLNNFQGSTSVTGNGYMFYDGPERAKRAGCLVEHRNAPRLRLEKGKWRQRMAIKFLFEDLPQRRNRVLFDPQRPRFPIVDFKGHSPYALRASRQVAKMAETMLASLPVERIHEPTVEQTESHVLTSAPMGRDPKTSVVDRTQRHHQVRNLALLGASSFPTGTPSNPTLTISALSLWSAQKIFGSAA